jgi:ferredoxin
VIVFYFTGTGNSLAVAKRIGGNLISIPQVIDSDNLHYEDDAIGVVFPVYALAAPKIVRCFLEKAQFKANYTFAIGAYGGILGTAMLNVQKLVRKKGYRFDYTGSILMVDNFLPTFEIEKQIAKLPEKRTEEKIARVVEDIRSRKQNQAKGSIPLQIFTAVISGMIKYDKYAQGYIVNNQCTKCGICAQVCPAKNCHVVAMYNSVITV